MKQYKFQIITGIVFLIIFEVYLLTTFPSFKNNDSPETITGAITLGIGHPPSYPLYSIAGKLFSVITFGNAAFKINQFSVFLTLCLLFITIYIIRRDNIAFFENGKNYLLLYVSLFILATASFVWNPAIEAKGGIYIMNLCFFALILLLYNKLLKTYNPAYLYLITFLFSLALTNHWPSTVILLPVISFVYLRHRQNINLSNVLFHILFFVLGLTPYLYLPIRGGVEGVFVFMAKPTTWELFLWTILRSGYSINPKPLADVFSLQIVEYFKLIVFGFYFLGLFIVPGIIFLYKKNKEMVFSYSFIFIIISFFVLFFNRADETIKWVIDLFMMPGMYILYLFLILGLIRTFSFIKNRIFKGVFLFILIVAVAFLGIKNYGVNNNSRNFLSYDFANNMKKTFSKNSFFMPENDFHAMTIPYLKYVEKSFKSTQHFNPFNLQFEWGKYDFKKRYGNVDLDVESVAEKVSNIIEKDADKYIFSFSTYRPELRGLSRSLYLKTKGIIFELDKKDKVNSPAIFDLYAYRGIYDTVWDYDKRLVDIYGNNLSSMAYDYFEISDYDTAISLYNKALLFPVHYQKWKLFYDLSLAYKAKNNYDEYIINLYKTVGLAPDSPLPYEALGKYYFDGRNYPISREMFESAINHGSLQKKIIEQYFEIMNTTDMQTQMIVQQNNATKLLSLGIFDQAKPLFDFLLRKKFNVVEIYKNIGLYYYKNMDYKNAIELFYNGLNNNPDGDTYVLLASSLFNVKRTNEALKVAEEGLKKYPSNQQLKYMYQRIKSK